MTEQETPVPGVAPEAVPAAVQSEEQVQAGAADTPVETQETDAERNEREIREQRERSEKRARGVQKRLDELTADKYEARQRAEAAERRAQEYEEELRRMRNAPQQPSGPRDGEPKREAYADYESYLSAKARWEAKQEASQFVQERLDEQRRTEAEARQRYEAERAASELTRNFQRSRAEFVKSHADFDEVIAGNSEQIPPPAALAIMAHPDAAAIMYHLGTNEEFIRELQSKPPLLQSIAIGELAATLRKSPQVSAAPPPGKPVGVRGGPVEKSVLDPDISYKEYEKLRRAGRNK